MCGSLAQVRDDGGVVRGDEPLLLLAIVAVDPYLFGKLAYRRRPEQEIDSKSHAAVEGAAPVIPPGEPLFVGISQAEEIYETAGEQALEGAALLVSMEDGATQGTLVPTVYPVGADIEVTT